MGLLGQAPSQLITATDGSVGEGLRWNGKKILITIKPHPIAGFFVSPLLLLHFSVMKKVFLFILPLFISVGVSQDVIYTTTLYNDENFTGKNSRVESITYYKKTRNGLVKFRYEEYYKLSGNLFIKGAYKDGIKDGNWIWYNENGQINSKGNYKDGKRFGKYTYYYENSQKKFEESYKDGIKDGKATLWDESGQKRSEETYKNGESISEKWWDENGNLIE